MIHITLDGRDGMGAIHNQLSQALDFPDYYGKNLDALYDCLTEMSEDVSLTLKNRAALGARGTALAETIRDAAAENPHICFLEEEGA